MARDLRHGGGRALSGGRVLCRLADLPDGAGRGFDLAPGPGLAPNLVMVLRFGDRIYGYRNVCPHIGTPLDLVPDQFLTLDRRHILCRTHGAKFRIHDGYCIAGPCLGKRLAAVTLTVVGDSVVVEASTPAVGEPGAA